MKSRQHFRAGFEAMAEHVVLADKSGVCSSDYAQFSLASLSRPIYLSDVDMRLVGTD